MPTQRRYLQGWPIITVHLALSITGIYFMRFGKAASSTAEHFGKIGPPEETFMLSHVPAIELRRDYTGIGAIDMGLSFLVAAFMPGAASFDPASWLQQIHFLFSFAPIITMLVVEAQRPVNAPKLLTYTGLWSVLYQTVAGAFILPLWFVFLTLATRDPGYYNNKNVRSVRPDKARALFPALLLGYVLPTALMYLPMWSAHTRQALVALWQPCPLIVNLLVYLFSSPARQSTSSSDPTKDVCRGWSTMFWLCTVVHVGTILALFSTNDPRMTFVRTFVPVEAYGLNMADSLRSVFQVDFWVIMASALLGTWTLADQLYAKGSTSVHPVSFFARLLIGSVVVGPGAAIAAAGWWRESRLNGRTGSHRE